MNDEEKVGRGERVRRQSKMSGGYFTRRTPGGREDTGRESDRPTGVRRRTGGDPVNHRPVERADHGRSALGLQVKLDAKRRKLVGARGFEPPTT